MKKTLAVGRVLTVILRNDAPIVHCNDGPSFRSIRIKLTRKQREQLLLEWGGSSGGADMYETVSNCFIEREPL